MQEARVTGTDKLKEIGRDIYDLLPDPVQDEIEEAIDLTGKFLSYTGPIDVLDGCWLPFANNISKLLGGNIDICTPVVGKSEPEDIVAINDKLHSQFGDDANNLMPPSGHNPLEDGVGVVVEYANDEAEKKVKARLKEYGLSTAPNNPNMIVPMGLYSDRTPYDIAEVDTNKYHLPSDVTFDRFNMMNEVFENIYSPLFYEPEWAESQQLPGAGDLRGRGLVRGDVQNPELRHVPIEKPAKGMLRDGNMVLPRENNRQLARDLALVIAKQESDYDYNTGWNDSKPQLGAYQFSEDNWTHWRDRWLADGTSIGGKGQTVSSTPSSQHQDAVARYKFEKMLDDMGGDIGSVAVEHVAGEPAVYRYYNKGLDFIWDYRTEAQKDPNSPEYQPPAEESNHPTAFEYAGYINRSLWNYMKTGEVVKGHELNPLFPDNHYEQHDPKGEAKDRTPDQSSMGMEANPVPLAERRNDVRR